MARETPSGRRVDFRPPQTEWPELQGLAAKYRDTQQERKVVEQRLSSLQRRGREAAQERDAIALAEAIERARRSRRRATLSKSTRRSPHASGSGSA